MKKKLLGCGVSDHDIDCLCDVHITGEPWTVGVTIPDSYWCGEAITTHFNLGVPWTGADLATFFEGLAMVQKHINRNGVIHNIPVPNKAPIERKERAIKKLDYEQLQDLKDWIKEGITPTPATVLMWEKHGVKIHKSYVTKTKVRMIKRGELK